MSTFDIDVRRTTVEIIKCRVTSDDPLHASGVALGIAQSKPNDWQSESVVHATTIVECIDDANTCGYDACEKPGRCDGVNCRVSGKIRNSMRVRD